MRMTLKMKVPLSGDILRIRRGDCKLTRPRSNQCSKLQAWSQEYGKARVVKCYKFGSKRFQIQTPQIGEKLTEQEM